MFNGFVSLCKKSLGLIAILSFFPATAFAIDTERLLNHKNWYVQVVSFDDGSLACEASVQGNTESFSIWTYPDQTVEIQFYLEDKWFGDEETSNDIEVEIDRRGAWDMTEAVFYKNSIFFTLPGDNWDLAMDFVGEVARGSRLYLRNEVGADQAWFSLAGSSRSIDALAECQDLISQSGGW